MFFLHKKVEGFQKYIFVFLFCIFKSSHTAVIHQVHVLTSWSTNLLEKLVVSELLKKSPVFNGSRKFSSLRCSEQAGGPCLESISHPSIISFSMNYLVVQVILPINVYCVSSRSSYSKNLVLLEIRTDTIQ
jgi:hypothetical protein